MYFLGEVIERGAKILSVLLRITVRSERERRLMNAEIKSQKEKSHGLHPPGCAQVRRERIKCWNNQLTIEPDEC
jgi:hypothetical protein